MDRTCVTLSTKCLLAGLIAVVMFASSAFAGSPFPASAFSGLTYGVVYPFPNESHGYRPYELIADSAGNLYGATQYGGNSCCGVVFQLAPPAKSGGSWTETVLYSFNSGRFGAGIGSLLFDQSGNLYGVASAAGKLGFGFVFKLMPPNQPGASWTETTIYSFSGWDGYQPGGLTIDQAGNLYGTTYGGGIECRGFGCGTVYMLTPPAHGGTWKRTVLYFFKGVLGGNGVGDGANPFDVIFDANGNLYGATSGGGQCQQATCNGTIFELKPPANKGKPWTESVLYRFSTNLGLVSGVVFDKSGALYGATLTSVYQLALKGGVWTYTDLQDFNGGSGGYYLLAGVTPDQAGNLYGTTAGGGTGDGIVFQLVPPGKGGSAWTETVLHDFAGGVDGNEPAGNLVFGKGGFLYGTTLMGGADIKCGIYGSPGCGTVFRIAP
jgi:uncharacterized repeat protein (TIGR03803 family)